MQERTLWVAAIAVALLGCVGAIVAGVGGLDLYDKSKTCRDRGDTDLQHGRAAAIIGTVLGCVGILGLAFVTYVVVARWPDAMERRSQHRLRAVV